MAGEITIVASIDGKLVAWSNGYFSADDQTLLREVKTIAALGEMGHYDPIPLGYGEYVPVMPDSRHALGAAASMRSVYPGRTIFLTIPEVLDEYLTHPEYNEETDAPFERIGGELSLKEK